MFFFFLSKSALLTLLPYHNVSSLIEKLHTVKSIAYVKKHMVNYILRQLFNTIYIVFGQAHVTLLNPSFTCSVTETRYSTLSLMFFLIVLLSPSFYLAFICCVQQKSHAPFNTTGCCASLLKCFVRGNLTLMWYTATWCVGVYLRNRP